MPRKKTPKKKSKGKRKRRLKRKHLIDTHTHARRRHARTRRHSHKHRMASEIHMVNTLLTQLLKTAAPNPEAYHYDKRHYSKDPEYKWETSPKKKFKRSIPYADVNFLRPQGDTMPPHRGNYPDWHELVV